MRSCESKLSDNDTKTTQIQTTSFPAVDHLYVNMRFAYRKNDISKKLIINNCPASLCNNSCTF